MSGPPVCVLSLFKFFVRSAVACADLLQSMCDRVVGEACICPNSNRDLYKTQHDCGRKKSKLRRSIVFRLRRRSPPRRRRSRRLAFYGLLALAPYGLLALPSYDRRLRFLCFHCLGVAGHRCGSPRRGRHGHRTSRRGRCGSRRGSRGSRPARRRGSRRGRRGRLDL